MNQRDLQRLKLTRGEDINRPDSDTRSNLVGEQIHAMLRELQKSVVVRLDLITVHDEQSHPSSEPLDGCGVVLWILEKSLQKPVRLRLEERVIC